MDPSGELALGIVVSRHVTVEIREELEVGAELRVVGGQHVVNPGISNQDDFGRQRYGLWFQRNRRCQVKRLAKALGFYGS